MSLIINPKKTKLESNNSPIPDYIWKASGNLGKELNLQDMNCKIISLEKGKYSYPYHYHHNAEEFFVIISGRGELRTPQGIKDKLIEKKLPLVEIFIKSVGIVEVKEILCKFSK